MSKFRTIRLPEGTPGLKVEDVQKDQHPSAAVGAESDTPAKQADRKLAEFIIKTYQKDIFPNIPKPPGQANYRIVSNKITLRRGTAQNEHVAAAEGRTFLVCRDGLPQGKKIGLTVGSDTSQHACDNGSVFLLEPGVKIGVPTEEECYPDAVKLLKVVVMG